VLEGTSQSVETLAVDFSTGGGANACLASSYNEASQLASCNCASALTTGLVTLEVYFRFVNVLSNAVAEVRSRDAHGASISPPHEGRSNPQYSLGTFQLDLQHVDAVVTAQELISFVVIRFKTCLTQGIGHCSEETVPRLIPIIVQRFETVYVTHGNRKRHFRFIKSPSIRQSCHFGGEQFALHFFPRHLGYTLSPLYGDSALSN
jgi:hypothetical protein